MLSQKDIWEKLKNILDPELGVSFVDLGLIYDVSVADGQVKVIMTLTSMGCPLFPQISTEIEKELKKLDGVEKVKVKLTFDPPWGQERMSKKAKAKLGIL